MNERNPWMRLAVDNDQRWRDCSAERYELKRRLENAAAVCRYLRGEMVRLEAELARYVESASIPATIGRAITRPEFPIDWEDYT